MALRTVGFAGIAAAEALTAARILRIGNRFEMRGIHATAMWAVRSAKAGPVSVMAEMVKLPALGGRPDQRLIGEAMGLDHPPAIPELPITVGVSAASPQPASLGLVDLQPEAFLGRAIDNA